MSKRVWKWAVEMMSDTELVDLANSAKVKVPGFRSIGMEQIKFLRPRLAVSMSVGKDLVKVKRTIDDHVLNCETCSVFRGRTQGELLEEIEKGRSPVKVLVALLSSPEQSHQMMAELLFEKLETSGALEKYEERVQNVRKTMQETEALQNSLAKQQEEQSKQLKKLQSNLLQQEKDFEEELERLKRNYANEQAEWQEKIEKAQQNVVELQSEFEKERGIWKSERESLLRQLEVAQSLLSEKQLVESAAREVAADQEVSAGVDALEPLVKKPVALVGKLLQVTDEMCAASSYDIQMVEVTQVDQALERNLFADVEQVWVLSYEAPLGTQRKIRRHVDPSRLREFQTLKELQRYMSI